MDIFELGERVREERRARGLTQEELGQKAGLSRVRIGQLESGQLYDMKFSSVMSVLNELDLTFRIGPLNAGRPVLDDLLEENLRARNDDDGLSM